jgi:hypothetical protein
MGYKPRTSLEINTFKIEKSLKKMKQGQVLTKTEYDALQSRFDRLKKMSQPWYDDLHEKYIQLSREKSILNAY